MPSIPRRPKLEERWEQPSGAPQAKQSARHASPDTGKETEPRAEPRWARLCGRGGIECLTREPNRSRVAWGQHAQGASIAHFWSAMADPGPAIVLVGDEPLTRSYLRRLLQGAGFDVRAEASDAETGIELCLRERPALCLVDYGIPGGGLRVVREVSQKVPETRLVVLSATADRNEMIDAIRAGA